MVKDASETVYECRYPVHRVALKCNFPQLEDVFMALLEMEAAPGPLHT